MVKSNIPDIESFAYRHSLDYLYANLPSEFVSAFRYAFLSLRQDAVNRLLLSSEVKVDDRIDRPFSRVDSPHIHLLTEYLSEYNILAIPINLVTLTYSIGSVKRFQYKTIIVRHMYDSGFVYRLSLYFKYKCDFPFTDDSFASTVPDDSDLFIEWQCNYLSALNYDLQHGLDTSILKSFVLDNLSYLDTMLDICNKGNMQELLMFILNVTQDVPKSETIFRI